MVASGKCHGQRDVIARGLASYPDKEVVGLIAIAVLWSNLSINTPVGPPGSTTVFENVPPNTYTLRVTAATDVDLEEAQVDWKVYVPARPTVCSVNLINFGMHVNGTRTTVEFQGVGPTSEFSCRMDRGQFDTCEFFCIARVH